ncbi:sugar ABC transporter substrate-binding protein [Bacillus sp. MRMR6]|uniref:ABC transporter substrate-binding protein n=1 Tax=Bacillus sp. MRMR6 TaxID=1928617 RepID=UPI000952D7EB|nr:sugar ABC transporter substrate-binding protein [Bacillus sp. MRMR6]OLS40058.1 ABC transporter substrate-binding protein [Bacillus sp. MRMR6]
MRLVKLKSLFFLAVAAMLLLAGCTSTSGNGEGTTEDGKVKVRFATWDVGDDVELQQGLIDQFNKSHEDIEVVLEAYGSEYDTKITAGMGAKDAPDVMYMWNYPQYKGALESLDSYIEKEGAEYKDNFYETLWNYNSVDDKILGLPVGYTTHVVYYNKALFDAKGLGYPKAGWTWSDLQETAMKLSDKSQNISGFAISGQPDPYDFEMFLWGNNAAFVDEKGSLKGNLDSPESIEVFELFQGMVKDGSAITTEGSGATEMKSGKVAMFVYGAWGLNPLKEAGIDYGVVELPKFDGGKSVSILSSSGISISKDSKHKEAAFEFIKFWTGEEANKARIDFELPVLKSVVESEKLEQDEVKSVFYSMLEKSEGYTPASFIVENWSQVSENLNFVFEQIFNPSSLMDPKKALSGAVE